MRPTYLQLRDPSQQTAEYSDLNITHNGQTLFIKPSKSSIKGSFQRDERFFEKSNTFVGPGSYNADESFKSLHKVRCPSVIKKPSNYQSSNAHEYIIVGNCVKHVANLKNTANKSKSLKRKL
jgi:hypothetical protein